MSSGTAVDPQNSPLPESDLETRYAAEPAAHGARVQAVFDDSDLDDSLYQIVRQIWYDEIGDRDREPGIVAEIDTDTFDWLPPARQERDWVVVLKSSRWKAGTGEGDDYSAWYKYDLNLREIDSDDELHKPPSALSLRVEPQRNDLNYKDGNELELPYGEGSRVTISTTWADSSDEIERRMIVSLDELLPDVDAYELLESRVERSRRVMKAEAHHRFEIGWKRQVIETIEQSKQLVAYGGASEIDAHQTRMREGWLEAVVDVDRWELLGFPDVPWNIELKCYQSAAWTEIPKSEPGHHPKIEASFSGVNDGKLPHVDEWDRTLQVLRQLVAAHLEWAGVDRGQLVADDYQDGPASDEFSYGHPVGRREQLQERYESVATEIYREATKAHTKAVYDILRITAVEAGATYDTLEEQTGLARSTIRYHVRRLQEIGVVDRIGNPVIVVFPSPSVLERAKEIIRTVYPGDEIDDVLERAAERREKREQRDHPDDVDGDTDDDRRDDDLQDNSDDDSSSSSSRSDWRYFADVDVEPHQIANALERGYLDDDELRVRVDRHDWLIHDS